MKVLQNLYYIYKIPSNKIGKITKYSFQDASKNGDVVSIGDNLVLAKIREYYGDTTDHITLYNQVQNIRKEMKIIKKEQTSLENIIKLKELQGSLDKLLYIDDIVNIKILTKKEYKKIARDGFDLNGKHYIRFMVGSGQMRRNTVTFINDELFEYMQEHLMCGLRDKIKNINLAKLSAYFALSLSSVLWVRTPRVCLIKDFETVIPQQKINWIYKDGENKNVEERTVDVKLNSADGQGIISPEMAKLWAEDMHLKYTPCSFVIRTAFVKGNLVPFDFKQYAKENNIIEITDRYGTVHKIEDIDVLLSESQFKMAKYYSSWDGYLSYHESYNLKWGVARYNKENDDEYVLTNYQYLQVLDLDKEDIKGVTSYTTNWIKDVCTGNPLYSLSYNIGVKSENESVDGIINSCGSNFTKAIIKNPQMLEDGYIQRKIYNSIKESIRQAKLGRIWIRGNYQFMISDPLAQCRSALGLSPDGLLKAGEVYSDFWNHRDNPSEIALLRSPLTHYSEVNIQNVKNNEEMKKWYKHIYSGIIYNIYDIGVCRHADSDFDGDIVCSTDDKYFLKGALRDELPITYDKALAPSQKVTLPNQIKCDIRGLDTKVGQITNYSTCMLAMLPMFNQEKQTEQKTELEKRLKLLREIQGAEIDKIKGTEPPSFPKEWKNWAPINNDDDDITKSEKYKYNSMVVKKKPYFFIYLYQTLMDEYKSYEKNFNSISMKHFGVGIRELLKKENKGAEEISLIRKYRKYSPILETDCVMNILCKNIENTEFDIKYRSNSASLLPNFAKKIEIDENKMNKLFKIYKEYKSQKRYKSLLTLVENEGIQDDDINEILHNVLYSNRDECKSRMYNLISSSNELFNYLAEMCLRNKLSYDFIWDVLGDDIVDVIPKGNSLIVIDDEYGSDYLGKTYSLKEVFDDNI